MKDRLKRGFMVSVSLYLHEKVTLKFKERKLNITISLAETS